jgi:CubicO group peptidase (beta-lactamase class C family)
MKKYILILCCLINNFSFSQYNSSKSDSIFSSYANEKQYMGNVLVAKGKKIIYQNSFGYSDIDNKIKIDSNSIFYLASLAKPITASAILWLEQERKLNTRDKITKYLKLPEYNLTIEHLLTHTSGFGDLYQTIKKYGDTNTVYGNKKLIKLIYKVKPKLESPIGSKWFYSDINYILLASIIERVSGERYEECIRNIFYKNSIYNLEKSSLLLNKVKKTKLSIHLK